MRLLLKENKSTLLYNCRRTTSVGLPVVLSHTQNTTQVVGSIMGYVIISPLSLSANIEVTPATRLLAPAR